MNGVIKISVLAIDEEDIQFPIKIENNSCKTSLDLYGEVDSFQDFGKKLSKFPESLNNIIQFELEEDDRKWAYYVLIKAFCYDRSGHSALKIVVANFGDNISGHRSEFSIISEASSINLLGQTLMT